MASETSNLSVDIPTIISPADDPVKDDDDSTAAVVIDNGSAYMKAGLSGKDLPQSIFPTMAALFTSIERDIMHSGYTRNLKISHPISHDVWRIVNKFGGDRYFIGNKAMKCSLPKRFIHNSIITEWECIEQVWEHTIGCELNVKSEDRNLFMMEPPLNPKANREKTTVIAFETLNVPAFYLGNENTMTLYASGRTTGVTLKCGYDSCVIAPVYEGYIEKYAICGRDTIGGRQLTEYLHKLLYDTCESSSIAMTVANDIKEKLCFVATDKDDEKEENVEYKLPDGNTLKLQRKLLSKCCEALFDPKLVAMGVDVDGLSKVVYTSIMKTSVSYRKDLYNNIVVSGGSSMFEGLSERIQRDVAKLAPDTMKIVVIAPPERQYSAWIGGSILTSLSTFEEMWIRKAEFDESGPSIVHRKCY